MAQYITIICEGKSEVAYIKQLQRFLNNEINNPRPLVLFPVLVGTGFFADVYAALKQTWGKNKKSNCEIWIDFDLYHRNEENTMTQYRQYRTRSPNPRAFLFSYYNFEDFFVLHYPEDVINQWQTKFNAHIAHPLHSDDYMPLFKELFPGYKKGEVPLDFISWESLGRLKANVRKRVILPPQNDANCGDFMTFLLDKLNAAYPGMLNQPS